MAEPSQELIGAEVIINPQMQAGTLAMDGKRYVLLQAIHPRFGIQTYLLTADHLEDLLHRLADAKMTRDSKGPVASLSSLKH